MVNSILNQLKSEKSICKMWQGAWESRNNHTPWTLKEAKQSSIPFWCDIYFYTLESTDYENQDYKRTFIFSFFPLLSQTQQLIIRLNGSVG